VTRTARHFHWRGDKASGGTVTNWGDRLGPLITQRFASIETVPATFELSELVTVGSVLGLMPSNWPGIIAGAGKLRRNSPFRYGRQTQIVSLRGPLTAKGVPGDFGLGDPALLSDELLSELPLKEHDLGVVVHWSDSLLAARPRPSSSIVIRANEDPLEVIRKIGSCRKIITSSLHGAIVADAFGVPRQVEEMKLTSIDTAFKWMDYHASVKMRFVPSVMATPKRQHVEDLKQEVWDAFRSLGSQL
jgi:pyruvyltransferase